MVIELIFLEKLVNISNKSFLEGVGDGEIFQILLILIFFIRR